MGNQRKGSGIENDMDSNLPFHHKGREHRTVQLNVQERAATRMNEIDVDNPANVLHVED
ncbi:hypothetical protein OEV98_08030 [Caldibacillus lycopersici]|uniref:Uncharacterized protein n=1 Tax=Perspicuibacillus lycopersici TaxID=1325689 RepID=A0AAE3IU70_9BACI|nr:hypothetical protein [Perspicuibacillus lycopersici]MCU9613504.1 hypothetical protein [Perspicuibacillus lycopersici]